jgi:glycosyltransferase involved in cell wall biosynthesis
MASIRIAPASSPQRRVSIVAGTLALGGAERQLTYITRAMLGLGWSVQVVTFSRGEHFEDEIVKTGASLAWIPSRSRLVRILQVSRAVRRHRSCVVQSQHFYTNVYAAAAGRVLRIPDIGAVRSNGHFELRSNSGLVGVVSLRCSRLLAVNSRQAIRNLQSKGMRKARLFFLPNVVDVERFRPRDSRPAGPLTLLGVGRLIPEKRFDRFIRVVSALLATGASVQATIIGDGPELPRLRALVANLGIPRDALQFRGEIQDVAPLYPQFDLLLHLPELEGTPNVVLEAMASGLPIVATPVGGSPISFKTGRMACLLSRTTPPTSRPRSSKSLPIQRATWRLAVNQEGASSSPMRFPASAKG